MKIKQGKEELMAHIREVNSKDGYSKACVDFAEQWAAEMEVAIANGEKLEDCADRVCWEVDKRPGFGITGYMYGAAVSILAGCWEHGETLRRWHNRSTQFGDEGDRANEKEGAVLNPALLTIGLRT